MARKISDDQIVFSTIHGSRLYGLDHEGSDTDMFYVVDDGRNEVKHYQDGNDLVVASLSKFLEYAAGGSHQSVEALFSPVKVWGGAASNWQPFLESMRVTGGDVFAKYQRTIRKFCYGDEKRRRHAIRLAGNLAELRWEGRCEPRLSDMQAAWCRAVARTHADDDLARLLEVDKEK